MTSDKLGTSFVSAIIALSFAGWAQSADAPDIGRAVDSIFQDLDKPLFKQSHAGLSGTVFA